MNFTTAAKKLLNPNIQVIERMEFGNRTNNEHPYASGVYLAHNFNKKPSSKTLDFVCLCKDTGQQCRDDSCIRYYKYRACGDNCRNEDCQNKGLASRMNSNFSEQMGLIVDDVNSKGLGLGVITNSFIPANADIATYFGTAIRGDSVLSYSKTSDYLVQLGDGAGTCIDGKYSYSYARFINHSCEPNCTLVPHQEVSGDRYVIVRTSRDIQPNEQLTVNYGFTELNHGELPTKCSCDSKSCKGFVELGGETALKKINTTTGMLCHMHARGKKRITLNERHMWPEATARVHYPGRFDRNPHRFLQTKSVRRRCQHCYLKRAQKNKELEILYHKQKITKVPKFENLDNKSLVGLCLTCDVFLCYNCHYNSKEWHVGPAGFFGTDDDVTIDEDSFNNGSELPDLEVETADSIVEPVDPEALAALDVNDSNDSLVFDLPVIEALPVLEAEPADANVEEAVAEAVGINSFEIDSFASLNLDDPNDYYLAQLTAEDVTMTMGESNENDQQPVLEFNESFDLDNLQYIEAVAETVAALDILNDSNNSFEIDSFASLNLDDPNDYYLAQLTAEDVTMTMGESNENDQQPILEFNESFDLDNLQGYSMDFDNMMVV